MIFLIKKQNLMYDNNSALQESLWKSCILFVDSTKSCLAWGIDALYFKDIEFKCYVVCTFIKISINFFRWYRNYDLIISIFFKAEIYL